MLWIGADWPIHDLAERYLYLVHMSQHLLFTLIAPPLLIAGMPAWLLRRFLGPRPVATAFGFLTKPLVALIVFNSALLFVHWPAVVELSVRSEWFHFGLHVMLVSTALLMWWPVMSPLPEYPALPAPGQMLYLFLQSLAPTIPASFLTFGNHLLYPVYGTFPRIWGISPADRSAHRGVDHEAHRRGDPVGVHHGDLLPVVPAGASRRGMGRVPVP